MSLQKVMGGTCFILLAGHECATDAISETNTNLYKEPAFPVGLLKTTLRPINNRRHNKRHCDCKGHLAAGKGSTTLGCQCNPEKRKSMCKMEKNKNLKWCKQYRKSVFTSPV
ncbi:hypothetical protein AMECASPLE_018116 [Ameca splendens]|uniref:Uncharacterized protein n=1 Tax=Ameca splendens TaxID=208324 RepID=A0ABV0Z1T3_9TELE